MTRAERAKHHFLDGCTCAQAIGLAFSDVLRADEETLAAALLPLGGGLSRLRETCGSVSGAAVCLGLAFRDRTKSEIYALVQELARKFSLKNGSYNCGALLRGAGLNAETSPVASPRTAEYYGKRPCPMLIYDAAEILEEILKREKKL